MSNILYKASFDKIINSLSPITISSEIGGSFIIHFDGSWEIFEEARPMENPKSKHIVIRPEIVKNENK